MDVTVEDVDAMRRDGSFEEFLRHHVATTRRDTAPASTTPKPFPVDPDHRPGAWPTGTRPPGPAQPQSPETWQQAVREYRAWFAAGCPQGDFTCGCHGCRASVEAAA